MAKKAIEYAIYGVSPPMFAAGLYSSKLTNGNLPTCSPSRAGLHSVGQDIYTLFLDPSAERKAKKPVYTIGSARVRD